MRPLERQPPRLIFTEIMNTTSRAILQSVLTSDAALTAPERTSLECALSGASVPQTPQAQERLLITQKHVAIALSINRVTVWRMTRDGVLHPVEILPGTWRYLWTEVAGLAETGWCQEKSIRQTIPAA